MNKDCKPFDNNTFIYPAESGIYSAREYNLYTENANIYAVSSFYRKGEEGVMILDENVELIRSMSGYVLNPVSVFWNKQKVTFWAEYNGSWCIKGTHGFTMPDIEGDVILHSACIDKLGRIFIVCEYMHGYMTSGIIVLMYNNEKWEISQNLNSSDVFCKRPIIVRGYDCVYVVWDGYGINGYDIYMNSYKDETWTGALKVSESSAWNMKPSVTVNNDGNLWIAWISSIVVERHGVIARTNDVMMSYVRDGIVRPVIGNNSESVISLNMGLLPKERYFGYHGLRRNPQIASFENGDIGLFWEMQRDENENWNNVENGYFLCKFYNGNIWSNTFIIQDGGNCFKIDSSSSMGDIINYSYRGVRGTGPDIRFGKINTVDLMEITLEHYKEWDEWEPSSHKSAKNEYKQLYFGDLHCHSIYSPDAEGYPDELFFYARDIAGIDFCAITDNDIYGDNILMKSSLRYIQTLCDYISRDGTFLAYTGYEWTYHLPELDEPDNFNHRTIIFLDDNHIIASRADAAGNGEKAFIQKMEKTNTLWHAHHGIWRILDSKHDANVEVVSAWTNNIESFDTVHNQLADGHIFGFMGASDNHRFVPGHGGALTGVISEKLSKDALNCAFFNRNNFACMGTKIKVEFSINGCNMGDIIEIDESTRLESLIRIISDRKIEYISIVSEGEVIDNLYPLKNIAEQNVSLQLKTENSYFYLKIKLIGEDRVFPHNLSSCYGNYVYSSPIWVNMKS